MATHAAVFAIYILGNLFQSPTLSGLALRSFSPIQQWKKDFPLPSALALFCRTSQPCIGASAVCPCRISRIPFATWLFRPGRDPMLPWDFPSLGFSPRQATLSVSIRRGPLSLLLCPFLTKEVQVSHRVFTPAESVFPPERVPTRLTFLPTDVRHLLRKYIDHGLFFHLGRRRPSQVSHDSSL